MPGKAAAPRGAGRTGVLKGGPDRPRCPGGGGPGVLLERLAVQRVPLNVCLSSNLSLLYRDPRSIPPAAAGCWAAVTLSRDDHVLGSSDADGGAAAGGGVCPDERGGGCCAARRLLWTPPSAVRRPRRPFGRRWRRSGAKAEDPQVPTPLPPHRMKRIRRRRIARDTISRNEGIALRINEAYEHTAIGVPRDGQHPLLPGQRL